MEGEFINLVDGRGARIGAIEKLQAHRIGALHEAFSIFIVDPKGEKMMLQKRARNKYHSGGLWTNACCSHPRWNETVDTAVHRRLREEMGFDCPLRETHSFTYKVEFDNGLTEYEFDRVFLGTYEGDAKPDIDEAEDWRWAPVDWIAQDLAARPEQYTYWFRIAFPVVQSALGQKSLQANAPAPRR